MTQGLRKLDKNNLLRLRETRGKTELGEKMALVRDG